MLNARTQRCADPQDRDNASADGTERLAATSIVLRFVDEVKKFSPGLLQRAESAQHGTGNRTTVLLFNAAHLHAHVLSIDNHTNAVRRQFLIDGFGNLGRQAFLNLQAPAEHLHQPDDFADAYDFPVRQVGHVHLAEERQEVMLAEAEEIYVSHNDHFVIFYIEKGMIQNLARVLLVAAGEKAQSLADTLRCPLQAISIRIFPQFEQELPNQVFHKSLAWPDLQAATAGLDATVCQAGKMGIIPKNRTW
jgi:hypothetical protein